ncbi:hypothetical protein J6590_012842 [Homalodisca vitripennis]|nr:hypothetical protein J6590_012842 [Homalodisca vitripennis]
MIKSRADCRSQIYDAMLDSDSDSDGGVMAESSGDEGEGGGGRGFLSHPYGLLSISSSASVSGMSEGGQGSGSPTSAAPGVKLPRTLSTSVLRIKHRTSFWDKFWQDRSRRD